MAHCPEGRYGARRGSQTRSGGQTTPTRQEEVRPDLKKDFQIAHAWGKYCEKCKKIFRFCEAVCPECKGPLIKAMSAFQVPRGCIFVYEDGCVPGGTDWGLMSDEEYAKWQEAINHPRPGRS